MGVITQKTMAEKDFLSELIGLINRHSKENETDFGSPSRNSTGNLRQKNMPKSLANK